MWKVRAFYIAAILSALFCALAVVEANAATITVSPGQSIQSAINAATAGDTVLVKAGTYTGGVNLNKAVILKGEPGAILRASTNGSGNGVTIAANGCAVEGLRIENFSMAISAYSAARSNVTIRNNHTYRSEFSCWINGSNWLVEGNRFERAYWWSRSGDCDYTRMFGTDHIFRNNYLYGTILPDDIAPAGGAGEAAHCDGIQWYGNNGEVLENVLIEGNYFTDFMDGIFTYSGNGQNRKNVTIRGNVLWGTNFSPGQTTNLLGVPSWGISVGKADNAGTNIVIENNLIRNCANLMGVTGLGAGSRVGKNILVGPGTGYYSEGTPLATYSGDMVHMLSWIGQWSPAGVVGQNPQMVNVSSPLGADGLPFTADDGWLSAATDSGYGPPRPGGTTPTPEPEPIPEPEPVPTPEHEHAELQSQIDALKATVDALKAWRDKYPIEVRSRNNENGEWRISPGRNAPVGALP